MVPTRSSALPLILALVYATPLTSRADVPLRASRVADGLSSPVFVTAAPGDASRLFIVEQGSGGTANIKILDLTTRKVNTTSFLTLSGLATGGEQGLLGLAFHPDYAANGRFFVNYTAPGGSFGQGITFVREYTRSADPNVANTTGKTILRFDQPQTNHNGGWIGFSPKDKYLYVATGDGGNGNDEGPGHTADIGNAQDTTSLLGKMLRLDVNADDFPTDASRNYRIPAGGAGKPPANPFATTGGRPEIWAYGLRNPWRDSFDRKTGDLWIGDVGQNAREEIDFQPAASSGGENYGWRAKEGNLDTGLTPVPPKPPRVDPIHDYGRTVGATVTGGYAYRGPENGALQGTYVFADSASNRFFSFKRNPATGAKYDFLELTGKIPTDTGTMASPVSFGEDAQGNLYVVDYGGEIYRLVPALTGDADLNRVVNTADFTRLILNYAPGVTGKTWSQGDFNDDHVVDFADFQLLEANFRGTAPFAILPDGTVVPEPTVPMTLLVATILLTSRRGRAQRRPGCAPCRAAR